MFRLEPSEIVVRICKENGSHYAQCLIDESIRYNMNIFIRDANSIIIICTDINSIESYLKSIYPSLWVEAYLKSSKRENDNNIYYKPVTWDDFEESYLTLL